MPDVPRHLQWFGASHTAALARLQAVQPTRYARTRNALDGAVTGLSPYFTHGILDLTDAARRIHQRHPLGFEDKLVFEFAWREFFHHVWRHAGAGGDAILQDMHRGLPWTGRYADALPDDIRQGRTGVPAIDRAVRVLYATGYLHNHARMWLASYVVHVRKVHWRAGADWLYGHLLDGDLPSNHLSWQWVAGTFSSKPYLFNADNVGKYAPADARAAWDSSGTVIDQDYETLGQLATLRGGAGPEPGEHAGIAEPAQMPRPPDACLPPDIERGVLDGMQSPSQRIELVHPWSLSQRTSDAWRIGLIHLPAHAAWPWSAQRWGFVMEAMAQVTDRLWIGDAAQLGSLLKAHGATPVSAQATQFPGYREALASMATLVPAPRLFPDPAMFCRSFSKFYERVRRSSGTFDALL